MYPPLRLSKLVKDYPGSQGLVRAVDHIDLELKAGEIFGLLGPNGAGKTSIISTIVTLEVPTEGKIEVFGYDPVENPEIVKSLLGYVPQELIHHGYFDIEEILRFHSGYFGRLRNKERIDWLMHKLGLYEHRQKKVKQLSGGMKRRLLIAKALVHEPRLLLLDEPTAGVDIELRTSLWDFVGELQKQGLTILLTTHYLEEAEHLCDRVGILQKGRLQRLGVTESLIQDLTQREIILTVHAVTPSMTRHPSFVSEVQTAKGKALKYSVPSMKECGSLLAELGVKSTDIVDLSTQEGDLEDVIRHVLKNGELRT